MNYRAVVEIEFETKEDPREALRLIMNRTGWEQVSALGLAQPYAEHYHILELPKELG